VSKTKTEGYLLDTSVLSAFAPGKPALPAEFAEWMQNHSVGLFIPCIAVAELEQGIRKLRRSGAIARASRLFEWMNGLMEQYADRILPLDAEAARLAGQIADKATAAGKHPGFPDVVIAALGQQNRLVVLTRNVRHFAPLGIACCDPFERLPD
jgi:predicted nucleic acid-binding protein